ALAMVTNFIDSLSSLDYINGFSGLVFGTWMLLAFYLSLKLVFSNDFRSSVLTKVSFFQERDEREAAVTATATRNSFLTTLALLIFLLCLSLFQVAVFRLPPEQAVNGKTGTISLGLHFSPINPPRTGMESKNQMDYFRYSGLPLSNSAVALILIVWLIGSYNYFARKELNKKV
ncbi:MAG: hypothetical protein ACK5V3_11530, partial [Bdellovibrionales bacterium]